MLAGKFVDSNEKTVSAVISYMKNNIGVQADFYSEIIALSKLYLASPATNAVSERSASAMLHFKISWDVHATRKIEWLYAAFNTQRKNWWNKPKEMSPICILWSEWREQTYLWYVLS